ncbi:Lymphocyte cytosolic protein 2, partial [Ophiophagus hannah]
YKPEEGDGWSSFDESDDYESPDEDQTGDGVDYETPNDQDGFEEENDADYEPPPSNDEDILRNAIFPHKPIPAISDYIDRPATERGKTSLQPPVPPQRPAHSPIPGASRSRIHGTPFSSPSSNNDSYRDKSANLFRRKRAFPEMALTPKLRSLAEDLAKIQKPPLPPTDRFEKNSPSSRRMPPLTKSNQMLERQTELFSVDILQRPVPLPSPQPFNTFPSRTTKSNIIPLPPKMKPDLHTESIPSSASLPSRLLPSNLSRTFSKTPADGRPPLPI